MAAFLAQNLVGLSGGRPWLLLLLSYAAVIMVPIVLAMTGQAGLDPEPFMLAVMMAASASFATPLGYQTNLMVYGPGGYRFSDFVRIGVPMNLVVGAATVGTLLLLYPLSSG